MVPNAHWKLKALARYRTHQKFGHEGLNGFLKMSRFHKKCIAEWQLLPPILLVTFKIVESLYLRHYSTHWTDIQEDYQ